MTRGKERIALAALMLCGSLFSSAAPAQAADSSVVMRRPLPHLQGSGQDSCDPSNPDCRPDPNPSCAEGHVCAPASAERRPDHVTGVYAWNLYCAPPEMASCVELSITADGQDYGATLTDNSFCAYPQSSEMNSKVEEWGFLAPGRPYDFTALCGGGDPPPDGPVPGLSSDASDLDPGIDSLPSEGGGWFSWSVGPWSGSAQCGQTSTLTRRVSCTHHSFDWGGGGVSAVDPSEGPGAPKAMLASATEGGVLVDGVLRTEGSSSPFDLILAQYGGGSDGGLTRTVDPQYCIDALGPPPPTRYTGDKAGCSFTPEVTMGEWREPWGGNPFCSSDAYREKTVVCRASDGSVVSGEYCALNLTDGGLEDAALFEPEHGGNFSGCTAEWQDKGWDVGCRPAGSPTSSEKGSAFYRYSEFKCVRSDGTILEGVQEAACPASDRGFDGYRVVGSCEQTFLAYQGNACKGEKVLVMPAPFPDYRSMYQGGGAEACLSAGANCCQVQVANLPNGEIRHQIVGTVAPPVVDFGWYYDFDRLDICYGASVWINDVQHLDWCELGRNPDGSAIYGPCNPSTAHSCPGGGSQRYGLGGSGKEWVPAEGN